MVKKHKSAPINLLFLVFLVISIISTAQADIIYVDDNAAGANTGTSWNDAYNYLQDALSVAVSGDEIKVAQGSYRPYKVDEQSPGSSTFQLINGVTIKGGYAGSGQQEPDEREVYFYETILTDNRTRSYLVTGSNTDETAIIDGFTIENSAGEEIIMRIESGSPTIINCSFQGDKLYMINDSSPTIINCSFISCEMENYGSDPTLTDCLFKDNSHIRHGSLWSQLPGDLTLDNCLFTNNSGDSTGVISCNGDLYISNCTFSRNSATHDGGAIRISSFAGEIVNYLELEILVQDCKFSGNRATNGGAIYSDSSLEIQNCIFEGNVAEEGGCIYLSRAFLYPKISNCSFYSNKGNNGIISSDYNNSINLTGCIIIDQIKDSLNVTYSNILGGYEGIGNIDVEPSFVCPGYWADVNNTDMVVEYDDPNAVWIEGDYHLQSQAGRWDDNSHSWIQDNITSPCIDSGDMISPVGLEPYPNGGIYNMGAYGRTAQASKSYFGKPVSDVILAGDINGDGVVNFDDLSIIVSQWMLSGEDFINSPPTVTLIELQNGDQLVSPDTITLKVSANDIDGFVHSVFIYIEQKTDTGSHFSRKSAFKISDYWESEWVLRMNTSGEYEVYATATDNEGAVTESERVTITIISE